MNIDPSAIPKAGTTTENKETSVQADKEMVVGLKAVPFGPGKVFKPYPTSYVSIESAEVVAGDPVTWQFKDSRVNNGIEVDYTITPQLVGARVIGFRVSDPTGGESPLMEVPASTDPTVLIRQHLNKTQGLTWTGSEMNKENIQKAVKIASSKNVGLLGIHGIANPAQVEAILYPEGKNLLDCLSSQDAFLVTKSFKIVDVATNSWPIDLEKAVDVRAQLTSPVKYGEAIGLVASIEGEMILVRGENRMFFASIQDLEPVMLSVGERILNARR